MRRLIFAGSKSRIVSFVVRWLILKGMSLESKLNTADVSSLLTLVLLNPDIPVFANSVDPDQLASDEANWSGSALFAIKYVNL